MKLGIISPRHDAEGIRYVHGLGLSHAEFDINGDDISYLDGAAVKAALKQYGVSLGAVGRWGRNRITPEGGFDAKELADEKALIDFCEQTGCPVYIAGINYVPSLSYFANITAAVGYIRALVDYSAGRVKIAVYNCSWNNYIDKPKEWELALGHISELGIKFDPSHSINGGRDYLAETADYGNRFYHVHIKGTINIAGRRIDDPPAGMDITNWGAFLSLLRFHRYEGMLSIEPHSQTWQGELGDKGTEFTINYMRGLLFEDK